VYEREGVGSGGGGTAPAATPTYFRLNIPKAAPAAGPAVAVSAPVRDPNNPNRLIPPPVTAISEADIQWVRDQTAAAMQRAGAAEAEANRRWSSAESAERDVARQRLNIAMLTQGLEALGTSGPSPADIAGMPGPKRPSIPSRPPGMPKLMPVETILPEDATPPWLGPGGTPPIPYAPPAKRGAPVSSAEASPGSARPVTKPRMEMSPLDLPPVPKERGAEPPLPSPRPMVAAVVNAPLPSPRPTVAAAVNAPQNLPRPSAAPAVVPQQQPPFPPPAPPAAGNSGPEPMELEDLPLPEVDVIEAAPAVAAPIVDPWADMTGGTQAGAPPAMQEGLPPAEALVPAVRWGPPLPPPPLAPMPLPPYEPAAWQAARGFPPCPWRTATQRREFLEALSGEERWGNCWNCGMPGHERWECPYVIDWAP